jgi:hypothetical protein
MLRAAIGLLLSLWSWAAPAQPFYRHGEVQLLNDGTLRDLTLGAYGRGNGITLWCPATSQWQLFKIPTAVSITNVADNGSGGVRVTHAGGRPFMTGQWITMRGITGVVTAPFGPNVFDNIPAGAKRITVISPTEFDLDGMSFTSGTYTGGGIIDPVVVAHVNHITINGVANSHMPENLTAYLVGLRYADAACTVAELVLDSQRFGPWRDYINQNKDPETGVNLLPSYDKAVMVGMVTRDPLRHVQGNANSILLTNWHHPSLLRIVASFVGNTGGVLNANVQMSPQHADGRLIWILHRGWHQHVKGILHITSTEPAIITARVPVSRGTTGQFMMKEFAIYHHGNGPQQLAISIRIPADFGIEGNGDDVFFADLYLRTTAGTAALMGTSTTGSWLGGLSSDVEVETFY